MDGYVPGVYAVKVVGMVSERGRPGLGPGFVEEEATLICGTQLPEDVVQNVEDAGVRYIP